MQGVNSLGVGPSFGGVNWNPSMIPGIATAGLWIDPSDLASEYEESTGMTPVTAVSDPVGRALDKRFRLARGVQNLVDPNFDDSGQWTASATWSIAGGICTLANCLNTDGPIGTVTQGIVVNTTYEVLVEVTAVSLGGIRVSVGGTVSPGAIVAPGTYSYILVAGATTTPRLVANGLTSGAVAQFSVRPIPGNHMVQATAAARPLYTLDGAAKSQTFDGTDDELATATFSAGTLTANMDCFIVYRRKAASIFILANDSLSRYIGAGNPATPGASTVQSGAGASATYYMNASFVGDSTLSQDQFNTAFPVDTWKVVEMRNLDLSTWVSFEIGNFGSGFINNADVAGIVLCPAQTDAKRAQIRSYLGAKVGLSL